MKLGPVTKLNKWNTTKSRQINDDVVSASYDVIVIFPIYGWFGAFWNLDSRGMVYDFDISFKQNYKISNT